MTSYTIVTYCDENTKLNSSILPLPYNIVFYSNSQNKLNEIKQSRCYFDNDINRKSKYFLINSDVIDKYKLMLNTLNEKETTHYCWIDFNFEHNMESIKDALNEYRDLFSLCMYSDTEFYDSFFTANYQNMNTVCTFASDGLTIKDVMILLLNSFHFYYGKKEDCIVNYKYIYANPEYIIDNIVDKFHQSKSFIKCKDVCESLLMSCCCKHSSEINHHYMSKLYSIYYDITGNLYNLPAHIDRIEYCGLPGREHYPLLSYLAKEYVNNGIIIELGTQRGRSSYALGTANLSNKVYTFDITDLVGDNKSTFPKNVNFLIANLWNKEIFDVYESTVLKSDMIFLDVFPHNGTMEIEFYVMLKKINYQGIIIFDDIHFYKGMDSIFWQNIPDNEKIDITDKGHWSGTGIVSFNSDKLKKVSDLLKKWKN